MEQVIRTIRTEKKQVIRVILNGKEASYQSDLNGNGTSYQNDLNREQSVDSITEALQPKHSKVLERETPFEEDGSDAVHSQSA